MDVSYDLSSIFEESPIVRLDQKKLRWITPRKHFEVINAINKCGEASAKAQNLRKPVTSFEKILDNPDEQFLYLCWEQNENHGKIIGYVKVGIRKLYLQKPDNNETYIVDALCLLDFFVFPEYQHHEYGKHLFDSMLEKENIKPEQIAFDRPPELLLNFLQKHYNLENPIWQSTHIVVFPQFFEHYDAPKHIEHEMYGKKALSKHFNDAAGDLIHDNKEKIQAHVYGPDTPRGRKNTRDFGHSNIFG